MTDEQGFIDGRKLPRYTPDVNLRGMAHHRMYTCGMSPRLYIRKIKILVYKMHDLWN
ncbi:uncharacterized protein RSE6_12946 [Rhynchosporium secalis]|uniref:Uncharacterized protein n=1 Tax=Rhynchosporium secalis TaxID=38038 RepID=A0A1E1MRR5_RHYSE|nr:uncharacterized protein RSE6_12946 [Rhynchosporium secalis]